MSLEFLMPKILVLGSLNIDFVYEVPHFLQPGETLSSLSRNVYAGGKGLNQAVALAKAGGDVYFGGAIGKEQGEILLNVLQENKINTKFLKVRPDIPCGHTFIQVDTNGQNCILLYGGANQSLQEQEIDECLSFFQKGDYVVVQNETNLVGYIITKAHALGLKVVMNVSPLSENIKELPLDLCHMLIVNEIEGSTLVNLSASDEPKSILKGLIERFANSIIVLTLGKEGSIAGAKHLNDVYRCSSFKVEAVDTTAAGDTFLGYVVCHDSAQDPLEKALVCATAASALAVGKAGATPSIPLNSQVDEFLAKHGEPQHSKESW